MKNAVLAAALCLAAAPALAGGYAEPVMEPQVIADAVTGSDDWVVPVMALLVFGAALAN